MFIGLSNGQDAAPSLIASESGVCMRPFLTSNYFLKSFNEHDVAHHKAVLAMGCEMDLVLTSCALTYSQ